MAFAFNSPPSHTETGGAFARTGTILAVDFGSVHTRALLIDLVDGEYQLVAKGKARTTAGFPNHNVNVGMIRAAAQLSHATGRRIFDPDSERIITPEQPDRSGVDIVRFTASIGRPLRTVLIGLVPEMSVASALRAIAGTYVQIVDTITLDDTRSPQAQLNALLLVRPDLIFIVGGTEGGADESVMEFVNLVRLALRFSGRAVNPPILFAGNSDLQAKVRAAFADITSVFVAENIRPSVEREQLDAAAGELSLTYDAVSSSRGLGFERISMLSELGVLPTAGSYDLIAEYLARSHQAEMRRAGGLLIADLGSAVSTLSAAVNGRVLTSIRTDIGVGHSAALAFDQVGIELLQQWLPFTCEPSEINAYVLNKTLHPAYIPEDRRSLFLEHALARAALRYLLTSSRPSWTPDTALDSGDEPLPPMFQIIGSGGVISETGRPGLSAMLMLDVFQPVGVTHFQLDDSALIPALGALARTTPEAVVQVLDAGGLQFLATTISLSGAPRVGRSAARVTITVHQEGGAHTERFTINGGTLWMYPVPAGMTATISVRVTRRGMSINGKRSIRMEIAGGTAGVIIDARGRPIPLPAAVRQRSSLILNWYAQATGDEVYEPPEEWFKEARPEVTAAQRRAEKRAAARRDKEAVETATDDRLRDLSADASAPAEKSRRRGKPKKGSAAPEVEPAAPDKDEDSDEFRSLFS